MSYGGSIIINSLGLYDPLVLSIAMLLRLLFNCICSSCFQSQILYEVSKIICPYIGRGKGAKKRWREERTKEK